MKKNLLFKTLFVIAFFYLFSISLYSRICANGAGGGYVENQSNRSHPGIIESHIITGAGYFLQANSDIMLVLNRVEMSELNGTVDFQELKALLDRADDNMTSAIITYEKLILLAEATPYKLTVIDKLMTFNYNNLAEKKSLDHFIMQSVQIYLEKGDVTGALKRIHSNFLDIHNKINLIKEKVNSDSLPMLQRLWRLNQLCFQTLLFGQYVAEVFNTIKVTHI